MQGNITAEALYRRFRSILSLGRALDLADSPIEEIFIEEAIMMRGGYVRLMAASTTDEFYDRLRGFPDHIVMITPQVIVGPYRCDFLVGRFADGKVTLVAVECDGAAFHQRTSRQRDRDARRDRLLIAEHGIKSVLRFEGWRLSSDPVGCVDDMLVELGVLRRVPRDWDDGLDDDAEFRLVSTVHHGYDDEEDYS